MFEYFLCLPKFTFLVYSFRKYYFIRLLPIIIWLSPDLLILCTWWYCHLLLIILIYSVDRVGSLRLPTVKSTFIYGDSYIIILSLTKIYWSILLVTSPKGVQAYRYYLIIYSSGSTFSVFSLHVDWPLNFTLGSYRNINSTVLMKCHSLFEI